MTNINMLRRIIVCCEKELLKRYGALRLESIVMYSGLSKPLLAENVCL